MHAFPAIGGRTAGAYSQTGLMSTGDPVTAGNPLLSSESARTVVPLPISDSVAPRIERQRTQGRAIRGAAMPQVMQSDDLRRAIHRIAHEIIEQTAGAGDTVLVGIHTRGVPLAERIAEAILSFEGVKVPVGTLDIGLYRDDIHRRPVTTLAGTSMPVDINGRTIVLVDDVLYTGRTVRAALDALADLGRPAAVRLAALVDRGHRQLPIRPDFVGKNLPTSDHERVHVMIDEIDGEEGVWIERRGDVT